MEFSRPVEVEDGVEWSGMSIKEELIVRQAVVGDQVQDGRVGLHGAQAAKAGVRVLRSYHTNHDPMIKCIYTCSSIFHMTSCRMPPTFRITLLCDFLLNELNGPCPIYCHSYLALMMTSELGILSGDSAPSLIGQDNVTSALWLAGLLMTRYQGRGLLMPLKFV